MSDAGPIQGVVVVVQQADRFLLIRRSAHVIVPHAWCFVGGAIEAGESQPDAVIREFREEMGGVVRPIRKLWEWDRADGALRLHWWQAALEPGPLTPNPREVAAFRWCTRLEILTLPQLLDSNRQFLEQVPVLPPLDAS